MVNSSPLLWQVYKCPNFDPEFHPDLTPPELLRLGTFCGKYMTDCTGEFPAGMVRGRKVGIGPPRTVHSTTLVSMLASPSLLWRRKGWIYPDDPRGWFQWYCRYYMGRRLPEEDARQIKRWKAMRASPRANRAQLRAGGFDVPPTPAPSLASLGL